MNLRGLSVLRILNTLIIGKSTFVKDISITLVTTIKKSS